MTALASSQFKIAFIGTHGVGKTTLCFGLAARLKRRDVSLEVVYEIARRCPLPINKETSMAAQSWILHTQISEEVLASARYPVVLCDRSVLDNFVYLLLSSGDRNNLAALVDHWIGTYDLLVHVPAVDLPQPDGFRSGDPAFQRLVETRLEAEMERRSLAPLRLRGKRRETWLDEVEKAIWDRFQPVQLALL